MKIGILTQPLGHNYGGILQNFALQKFLRNNEYSVSTINLRGLQRKSSLQSRFKTQVAISIKKVAKSYISKDSLYLALQDFIQNEIILTEPYNAPLKRTTLTNHNFDTFIVGSDQVWRPSYSPNLLNYFLDFCKEEQVRKISYGASFGNGESEYTSKELIECKKLLSLFDGVSVREETGVKSCKDLFDINSTLVCDPTLLLSADDYKSKINKFHGNSICAFYLLSPNFEKISFILSYCKKNNLIPVSMTPLKHSNSETAKHIFSPTYMISVSEWLGFISNSNLVITDSFHGTIFSVIFNTPFLTFDNPSRGSDRIKGFLNITNLENHFLSNETTIESENHLIPTIDWQIVNESLRPLVESSKHFLNYHLKLN